MIFFVTNIVCLIILSNFLKSAEHSETSTPNDDVHSVQTPLVSDVNMNREVTGLDIHDKFNITG